MQLASLDTATEIQDIDINGYNLHALKGVRKETWAIKVNANWRLTFQFRDSNAYRVNFEDYH